MQIRRRWQAARRALDRYADAAHEARQLHLRV